LKGLSSMSAAAKSTLNSLAVRFAQSTNASSSGYNKSYGEKGTEKEFKPFVASNNNVFFLFLLLILFIIFFFIIFYFLYFIFFIYIYIITGWWRWRWKNGNNFIWKYIFKKLIKKTCIGWPQRRYYCELKLGKSIA
jgi:hypothetical protein